LRPYNILKLFYTFKHQTYIDMRKFFRFVGILLLMIIVAVLVLGLIEAKNITVQRSMVINAPKDAVYDQIVKYSNWTHWSPWYMIDTTTKMTYTGVDGQPGNGYHWESNKIGEGEMTNTGVKDNEIDYKLVMMKPVFATLMGKDASGSFKFEDAGNGKTKVTWYYTQQVAYPRNALLAMVDMNKMLGNNFDDGLKNIQKYFDQHGTNFVNITETQFSGHIYAGVRKTISNKDMSEMSKFFGEAYGMLGKSVTPVGPVAGLYYTWDTINHVTDMAAVFPVADSSKQFKGAKFFNVPACKAYMVALKGPYDKMGNAHAALMKHVMQSGKKPTLVVEEYIKGPQQEKDSTKWETNIYYLVQ